MPQQDHQQKYADVLWSDLQPQHVPVEAMPAAAALARRSVVRMLQLYQPSWADRVARSSTPDRSQRQQAWPIT